MSEGFGEKELKVEINTDEVKKILKDYKKIKKYMKSPLFTVKMLDGSEKIVTNLLKELGENGEALST